MFRFLLFCYSKWAYYRCDCDCRIGIWKYISKECLNIAEYKHDIPRQVNVINALDKKKSNPELFTYCRQNLHCNGM